MADDLASILLERFKRLDQPTELGGRLDVARDMLGRNSGDPRLQQKYLEEAAAQRWEPPSKFRQTFPHLADFVDLARGGGEFAGLRGAGAGPIMKGAGLERQFPGETAITGGRDSPNSSLGLLKRHGIAAPEDTSDYTIWSTKQPLPYPEYDYLVHPINPKAPSGRWMNDSRPALPDRSYEESSPGAAKVFSDAVRDNPGYGASPGLPSYPRIPSHWVPADNSANAKVTIRAPKGISDATFTADSLEAMLDQIARTEGLKPAHRAYLSAMARQKFAGSEAGASPAQPDLKLIPKEPASEVGGVGFITDETMPSTPRTDAERYAQAVRDRQWAEEVRKAREHLKRTHPEVLLGRPYSERPLTLIPGGKSPKTDEPTQ